MSLNHTSQFSELTDDQFKLIGQVVVEWSNIEFLQKVILSRLLLMPEFLSRTYTDYMSAAKIQDAIYEAVELHRSRYVCRIISDEILNDIIHVNNRITAARSNRNKFAHFCWSRSNDNQVFGTNFSGGLPHNKKHKRSYTKISNTDIQKLYKESYAIVEYLNQIIEKLIEIDEDDILRVIKAKQQSLS